MPSVASRDLRNHTAEVLRQVAEGQVVTITVHGRPVAELAPVRTRRFRTIPRSHLLELLASVQADSGLTADLERLAGDTTDDLGPL